MINIKQQHNKTTIASARALSAMDIYCKHWLSDSNDTCANDLSKSLIDLSSFMADSIPIAILQKNSTVSLAKLEPDSIRWLNTVVKVQILTVALTHLLHLQHTHQSSGTYSKLVGVILIDYSSHELYQCRDFFSRIAHSFANSNLTVSSILNYFELRMRPMDWYEFSTPGDIIPSPEFLNLSRKGVQKYFHRMCDRPYIPSLKGDNIITKSLTWCVSRGIDIDDKKGTRIQRDRDGDTLRNPSPFELACKNGNLPIVEQLMFLGVDYSDQRTGDDGGEQVYENILIRLREENRNGDPAYSERLKQVLSYLFHEIPDSNLTYYMELNSQWNSEWLDNLIQLRLSNSMHLQNFISESDESSD